MVQPSKGEFVHTPTDRELMERLKDGDMDALEPIYTRYHNMVEAAVRRIVPKISRDDLHELLQDTFIALVHSAPTFDPTKRLKPWLYGIAVNKTVGVSRKRTVRNMLLSKHIQERTALGMHMVPSPSRQVESRYDLIRAFEGLPREQHEILILHVVEGFSGEEIASILNIKLNTVWTRLHRARKALSAALNTDRKGALGE